MRAWMGWQILVASILFFTALNAWADSAPGTGIRSHPMYEPQLYQAEQLMLSMQLDSAEVLVDHWVKRHPGRPAGLFFRAALVSWRMYLLPREADSDSLKLSFEAAVHDCRKSAEKAEGRRETEFEGTVYLGAIYGQEALLAMLDKRYLVMAPLAKRAWEYIQRAISLDPGYYDAYFGLGIYLYFTDALPKLVKVLATAYGFEGDRERGLASLKLASRKGLYSSEAARIMLMNIYSEMEKPDSGMVAAARELYVRYPDNPLVQWRYGDLLLRLDRFREAEEVFRTVLDRVDENYPFYRNSMYSEHSMRFRIGLCARKTGRRDEALAMFESIIKAGDVFPEWVDSSARLQAGELYFLSGKKEPALALLREVLRRDDFEGSHERARTLMKKMAN